MLMVASLPCRRFTAEGQFPTWGPRPPLQGPLQGARNRVHSIHGTRRVKAKGWGGWRTRTRGTWLIHSLPPPPQSSLQRPADRIWRGVRIGSSQSSSRTLDCFTFVPPSLLPLEPSGGTGSNILVLFLRSCVPMYQYSLPSACLDPPCLVLSRTVDSLTDFQDCCRRFPISLRSRSDPNPFMRPRRSAFLMMYFCLCVRVFIYLCTFFCFLL